MSPDLIDILACPVTGDRLRLSPDEAHLETICGKFRYPIRDGIPLLLPEEAV